MAPIAIGTTVIFVDHLDARGGRVVGRSRICVQEGCEISGGGVIPRHNVRRAQTEHCRVMERVKMRYFDKII